MTLTPRQLLDALRAGLGLSVRLADDGEGVMFGPQHAVDYDTIRAVEEHWHGLLCLLRAEAGLPPPPDPAPAHPTPPAQGELFGPVNETPQRERR